HLRLLLFFLFHHPSPSAISTLSLHDALPILPRRIPRNRSRTTFEALPLGLRRPSLGGQIRQAERATGLTTDLIATTWRFGRGGRSEEHTSELQSLRHLVCRLLLEKKKKNKI